MLTSLSTNPMAAILTNRSGCHAVTVAKPWWAQQECAQRVCTILFRLFPLIFKKLSLLLNWTLGLFPSSCRGFLTPLPLRTYFYVVANFPYKYGPQWRCGEIPADRVYLGS